MLTNNMNLMQMLEFKPNDEDMAVLPLDVVVYVKLTMISVDKRINYNFMKFLLNDEDDDSNERGQEVRGLFKDIEKSVLYDFEFEKDGDNRAITITELYSRQNFTDTEAIIHEILEVYTHDADVIFDFYTHDNHEYRLSNLDGNVILDTLKQERLT